MISFLIINLAYYKEYEEMKFTLKKYS